jgi:hypothetical protein
MSFPSLAQKNTRNKEEIDLLDDLEDISRDRDKETRASKHYA